MLRYSEHLSLGMKVLFVHCRHRTHRRHRHHHCRRHCRHHTHRRHCIHCRHDDDACRRGDFLLEEETPKTFRISTAFHVNEGIIHDGENIGEVRVVALEVALGAPEQLVSVLAKGQWP